MFIIFLASLIFQILMNSSVAVLPTATERSVLQKCPKTIYFLQKFCRILMIYDPLKSCRILQQAENWPNGLKLLMLKNTPAKYISRAVNGTTTSILAETTIFCDFGILQNSAESCRILQILQNSAEFCRIGAQKAAAAAQYGGLTPESWSCVH